MTNQQREEPECCPECGGTRFESDGMRGEKICSPCGCVVDESIIDLGPEGGNGGGEIVAQGTPEEVAECKKSYTGMYLKKLFHIFYIQYR